MFFLIINTPYSHELSGVWYGKKEIHPLDKIKMQLSWGEVDFVRNSPWCIGIDLESDSPRFYIGGQGDYKIESVKKINEEITEMDFFFSRGGFTIHVIIHINNGKLWIEPIDGITLFVTGEENVYYHLSRPPAIATHITVDNLRLRAHSDISAEIITTLKKGTHVQILDTGKTETIDGIIAPWVKVQSLNGYTGWCFSGYLRQLSEWRCNSARH
jgi:hypothetical protein